MRWKHYITIFIIFVFMIGVLLKQLLSYGPLYYSGNNNGAVFESLTKLENTLDNEIKNLDSVIDTLNAIMASVGDEQSIDNHPTNKNEIGQQLSADRREQRDVLHQRKIDSYFTEKFVTSSQTNLVYDKKQESVTERAINKHTDDLIAHDKDAIAVLVIACNRITVSRCLDSLIKYRSSRSRFPIIVSQDCGHEPTMNIIQSYSGEVHHMQHPDLSDIPVPPREKKFKGYYKIARHYGWALNQTFLKHNFNSAIIVEDDLDVSPDFYEYFNATLPLLWKDPTLWCISAWNDNGKPSLIDLSGVDVLYRSDFFPGLGWMMTKSIWLELMTKWPKSYWDDWIREPEQRQMRSCIRPEISRTKTFGKVGVSNGYYFDRHLMYIHLNTKYFNFTSQDISYLIKDRYDPSFLHAVNNSLSIDYGYLVSGLVTSGPVRITYSSKRDFKRLCKTFGLMDDFRSGVPRTAYLGIITFLYNSSIRVFLVPGTNWNGYEKDDDY